MVTSLMKYWIQWVVKCNKAHFEENDIFLGHRLEWFGGNNKNKTHIPALSHHRVIHPHTQQSYPFLLGLFFPRNILKDMEEFRKMSKILQDFQQLIPWFVKPLDLSIRVSNKGYGEKQNDP